MKEIGKSKVGVRSTTQVLQYGRIWSKHNQLRLRPNSIVSGQELTRIRERVKTFLHPVFVVCFLPLASFGLT